MTGHRLRLGPQPQEFGGGFGQEVELGGFVVKVEQAAAGGFEVEQQLAPGGVADLALNPSNGNIPLAPGHGRDAVEEGGRIEHDAAGVGFVAICSIHPHMRLGMTVTQP